MTRSKPPRLAYGPVCPKPEIEPRIRRGLRSCRALQPIPSLSSTPGRKFSSTTSAPSTRSQKISRSSAFLRSSVMPRLLRFHSMNGAPSPSTKGGAPRIESPWGLSILITSAPMSASCMPQKGPDRCVVRSRTTSPSSAIMRSLSQKLLEMRHGVQPLRAAELVGHHPAVLHDQEARRAAFVRKLCEHGLEFARPEALLVGFPQLGRFDLDPGNPPELGRGQPGGLVLVLPLSARPTV